MTKLTYMNTSVEYLPEINIEVVDAY